MIDALTAADTADAAALSASFGWPHRIEDWALFQHLGHGVAWREEGRLGGTAMWFPLDDGHAAIGLVQVASALQGRGIGRRLMVAVMEAAKPRALLLHATLAGAGLYAALGFVAAGTIRQWQGPCRGSGPVARPATPAERAMILRLDAAATELSRVELLDAFMREAAVAMTATGFAMRRRFGRGALIGPVVASDEPMAIRLVEELSVQGFVRLDIPSHATGLAGCLERWGLSCVGEVQAMTIGDWAPADRRFALAAQALG